MKKSTETETKAHTPVIVSMKRLTNLRQRSREFMRSPFRRALGSSHNQQASEPLRMNVRRKSTSPNSIGIDNAIAGSFGELVGDNGKQSNNQRESEALMTGALPMTMVTAMVSPRARARARKMEPMIAARAKGTTTFQVDSQCVEPRERAASRWSRGTESNTSRETEMM